uniref:Predicted protein n=1 Tax=Hordeum vulgare subsp. vulgare TaxID=112509 RepID=F2CS90_HORVV|nr:predicted protein [Hordeum vulgare subsp. vulgare]BAJ92586.1 predicted protein [Hordeum vulgare subsp. vulgare]
MPWEVEAPHCRNPILAQLISHALSHPVDQGSNP